MQCSDDSKRKHRDKNRQHQRIGAPDCGTHRYFLGYALHQLRHLSFLADGFDILNLQSAVWKYADNAVAVHVHRMPDDSQHQQKSQNSYTHRLTSQNRFS